MTEADDDVLALDAIRSDAREAAEWVAARLGSGDAWAFAVALSNALLDRDIEPLDAVLRENDKLFLSAIDGMPPPLAPSRGRRRRG